LYNNTGPRYAIDRISYLYFDVAMMVRGKVCYSEISLCFMQANMTPIVKSAILAAVLFAAMALPASARTLSTVTDSE
jgi:hypothetical protein